MKKTIAMLLAVFSLVSMFAINAPTVSAASYSALSNINPNKYCKAYALNTSNITVPYQDTGLTKRGTITYGRSDTAYIDNVTDEIWILQVDVNGKWAKVSYPCGSKRAEAYISLSAITSANASGAAKTSTGKFYCAPRFGSSTSSKYFVSKGEITYLISTKGNECQILYPNNTGWRLGVCSKSDYEKHCGKISNNTSSNSSTYGAKVSEFLSKSQYKNGAAWAASKTPLLSSYSCKGCCAYAADFVKYVFGKSSPRGGTYFTNINSIKAGDVIVLSDPHWFVVLERYSNGTLKVAEGNVNGGKVRVSDSVYKIQNGQLYRWGSKVTTFSCGYHFA